MGTNVSKAEMQIHTLRGLLHYHERMMLPHKKCPAGECEHTKNTDNICPNAFFIDFYAEALKEAIRCIEIVHKSDLIGS